MSNDVDFEQFIKLLDGALASDNKSVRQALRKFLFVAAMVMGDDEDAEPGPFTEMMDTIDALQRRVATLEAGQIYQGGTSTTPYWTPGTAPNTWTGGSSTSTGGSTFTNAVSNTTTSSSTGTINIGGVSNTATNITNGSTVTYTIPASTTNTVDWFFNENPETGTKIKDNIKTSLKKLANTA